MEKLYTFDDVLLEPQYSDIMSRHDVDTSVKLGPFDFKIPIIAANMNKICDSRMAIAMGELGGLGVIHRFNTIDEQYEEAKKVKDAGHITAVALGVKDLEERSAKLSSVADIFVIDIAHGHSKTVIDAIKYLKDNYKQYVIAGNVATGAGAMDLSQAGADCIKVGIGPGRTCQTRPVTGHGVPQLAAIVNCVGPYPIIADGGIKSSGDLVKALAAGATMVMLGNLLAGTTETPGEIRVRTDGSKYKYFMGMSSKEASNRDDVTPEGISVEVPFKGDVKYVIKDLMGGLKSGMTYSGARTLFELVHKSEFIRITNNGAWESMDRAIRR
ncbi:MAG: guanosine monophosphate reductase [bacterium]|nr:guanosine monophosphate reductase [bacterium]